MFPKKYSKDSSGRTFRLLTILGFCGVFPVLARESIFVMGAWKTEFVMGAWKTETNNRTCMAYVPAWIVMMMSCIKASSKWKHCDMPCDTTVFREECLEVLRYSDEVPGWSSNLFEDVWRDQQPLQSKMSGVQEFLPFAAFSFGGNPWGYTYGLLYEPKDDRCSTLKPGVTRLLTKTHKIALDKFAVIFVSMFTSHLPPFSYWMTSFKRRLSSHLPSSWTSSPSLLPNVDPIAPTFAEDCFFQRKEKGTPWIIVTVTNAGEQIWSDSKGRFFEKSSVEPGAVLFLAKTETCSGGKALHVDFLGFLTIKK